MKQGQLVRVLNTRLSGKLFLEGIAKIVRVTGPDTAVVRFQGERETVERFIDPEAQEGSLRDLDRNLAKHNRTLEQPA